MTGAKHLGTILQNTVNSPVQFTGVGLHSGKPVRMTVHPALPDHGIVFRRTDVTDVDALIPARFDAVNQSPLCTRLENAAGTAISTVEHIMAALAGCGVHNALIDVDSLEVPILDGSSAQFVRGLLTAGLRAQGQAVQAIEILKPVEVRKDDAWARLTPADELRIDFHIDFDEAAIGVQEKQLQMANGAFVRELSDCRTFCMRSDVEWMQKNGLALGGVPGENAVVFDGAIVESGKGGLRHADEPVRHKMLDALGDLALAGAPLLAHYTGHRAGHGITNDLLHALFADPSNYRIVTCDSAMMARLPGVGVHLDEIPAVA
ncbi:UDP-3-O-[3-hydroxymyristoyl] N-acetylglucosamine deacetylase [Thalassovita mediterranea]|jgi:UDP-3-O-[3-hydroxymyristoyl] N-acetylglucosamine deacetylase|uniref:UDP-3-O-acyl-N-acetylglucosamine deacetylase n=1 Tax=Thalassovita mediterranea TaxID=340021 RepID=A0A0P1HFP5_9RHOB|nr:UDP-3-O-[3-hydroxymyristoyl] N-acetylglucosamine deacetylase [Thalassovita mediterranea]SIS29914.1 UDP-3-O-[3-hydroxymyristoyl] N-acetylglucosamine deacetylase [Thalassovita mediterranea]